MRKVTIILFVGLLFLFVSCEKIIFSGMGELKCEVSTFDYFSKITIPTTFDVELVSDSVYSLEVESYGDYLPLIIAELDSNNLTITDENGLKWMTGYPRPKLRISFPRLDDRLLILYPMRVESKDTLHLPKLVITSLGKTGDFNLLLNVDYFQVGTGSDNYGSYIFKGEAEHAKIWTRGSSRIDASELQTKTCVVTSNSIGDCWVNVAHLLEARLNTLGNIYYLGDPDEINLLEESSTGRLLAAEIDSYR